MTVWKFQEKISDFGNSRIKYENRGNFTKILKIVDSNHQIEINFSHKIKQTVSISMNTCDFPELFILNFGMFSRKIWVNSESSTKSPDGWMSQISRMSAHS